MPYVYSDTKKNPTPKPADPTTEKKTPQNYADGVAANKPAPPVKRDLKDPEVVTKTDDATGAKTKDPYAYKANDRNAQLYGPDGVKAGDVKQGAIADCYVPAAMSAVAAVGPQVIKDALKDNGDGTFTVRFFQLDYTGKKTEVKITVDADLPHNGEAPAYAKSTEVVDGKQYMELWPSIIEKAYAQWKGSYDKIGHGGSAGDVMTALTGKASRTTSTSGAEDPLWDKMKRATAAGQAMCAGSGDKDDAKYKDPKAGVYGWHAYTVLGVEERKEGDKTVRIVKLRNPWGARRRAGDAATVGDTKNAAEFELTYAEFRRLYDDVYING